VNGLSLLALILVAIAIVAAYRVGRMHGRREGPPPASLSESRPSSEPAPAARVPEATVGDTDALRDALTAAQASIAQLGAFAEDRRRLYAELAAARADSARYRQVVVDLENDAPPPILGERGTPDDLKLIVGIGPVLERMLQQMGIATYRQIARWTERDIDEMDARLPEFPGRIRRDAWVTQARALHQSKYGERA
jgi:predicted flap endonuclease-1-like 5' DNA nuclease